MKRNKILAVAAVDSVALTASVSAENIGMCTH